MSTDQDERRHERTPLEVMVDWQVLGSDDVTFSATDDVSPGGIRVRTLSPPEVGTEVVVLISPADRHTGPARIRARVAWVRTDDSFCGMGVEFLPKDDEERAWLRAKLEKLKPPT